MAINQDDSVKPDIKISSIMIADEPIVVTSAVTSAVSTVAILTVTLPVLTVTI